MSAMERKFATSATLEPTEAEQQLFDVCLATSAHEGKGTIIRVAGGWVRDKLLGLNNDDIDLALDNMTGVEFGNSLQTYMKTINGSKTVKTSVIKANPDQSKHLETVTAHFCGFEIDITNLRSETYSHGSRIPVIKIGTPEEDASRRDLTINSLFYNLNTQTVEDFTGRGLNDLENKICATPLDPRVTFIDDPLRILRAVRFATRFQFKLDPSIIASAHDEEIRVSLSRKVSRERIGKELEGMLSGRNAQFPLCLKFFNQMNLLSLLFTTNLFPHIPLREEVDAARWYCVVETSEWLQYLLEEESSCIRKYCNTPALSRIAMLASPLTPFTGTIVNSMTKNKPISEASAVLQWSLKFKNKDCTDVATIVQSLDRLTELADSVVLRELDMGFRVEIGTFLREVKELWKPCLALATAIRIYSTLGSHSNLSSGSADMTTAIQSTVTPFITLCDAIEHFGLEEVWTLRPLVNGGELIDVLGVSAGPMIGEAMRKQTLWQLEHPQGTKEQFLSTLNPPVS